MLRRAVELGVNHIDTAAFYFSPLRSANELINRALAPYPDDLVIATKVGPRRDAVRRSAASCQSRQAARPGRGEPSPARPRPPRPGEPAAIGARSIAEHFGELAELRDAGLIRHLGVSNAQPEHLAQAQAIAPVVCVQNSYGSAPPISRTISSAPAASRASRSWPSSPSPAPGARPARATASTRRYARWRARTASCRAGSPGVDVALGPARAGHPRHRKSRPCRRQRRRRHIATHSGRSVRPRGTPPARGLNQGASKTSRTSVLRKPARIKAAAIG